jgi:lysozyme family protein
MAAKDKAVARTAEASQIAPSMGPARLLWESSMADENERFEQCLAEVLKQEGGYPDDKRDPGGATNLGVTLHTLAAWRKVEPWTALGKEAVKALGEDEAAGIYRSLYWQRCNCDALPVGIDLALFDYAVNSGPVRAIKSLQGKCRLVQDGPVGPKTIAALKTRIAMAGASGLINVLCNQRLSFL